VKLLRKKRTFALLFIFFLGLLFFNTDWLSRWMYPIKYSQEIKISAEEHQVDPILIASIIRVESNFRPELISNKKAAGLMQIMPETAAWIIQQANYSEITQDRIKQEDVNIHLGAWYLNHLFRYFHNYSKDKPLETKMAIVIAAYNAGPGNVEKWLHEGIWDGSPETSKYIPFGETRHYLQRVRYYYHKYESIYADDWEVTNSQ
jgi:soluble lytic murein transglycosylase